ncbi:MAG: type ISP restriction/modification enzyme [Pyrinomonadaceae bacterium]
MTTPHNIPSAFKDALRDYATTLRANFSSTVTAQPEDQLKPPVQLLLRAVAGNVQTRTEAQVEGLGARPDIGVARRDLLCGFVELKAPGKGARNGRFKQADKKQWEKFKALPNLLYTDGSEWALYRSGELISEVVKFSGDVTTDGAKAFDDEESAALHTLLLDFLNWQPIAPNSPRALAQTLAPLCRLLREDVLAATGKANSSLSQLAEEWRAYLFPDADDAQFADAYAQTLTYALLLARLSGEAQLTAETAALALDSGHGLLAQTLRVLAQPAARDEIKTAVDLLERVVAAVDPAQLQRRGDPWLYFYEDFLAEYDPELRRKRGVYYTPMQVIEAKVRLVAELLETHFDKSLSFADDGVIFLDPAAGTAAYPLAAIRYALDRVGERFGEGMVAARATECAHNVNAFEILVGPYAVAHLRLTQIITEAGGTFPAEGVQVFLTDTLESPYADPPQPNLFARRLTEEHRRAQRVKRRTRVLVCMGNPPYEREQREAGADEGQERKGGWVRRGDPDDANNRPIFLDFIEPATQAGAAVHVKNLYNDYVYFWRWVLWKLFENPEASGPGIVAYITASSYLRGPGFVGMRQKMRECFDDLWIIDLEGDNLGARKTENVFAIQTPVAIAIGVRYGEAQPETAARVRYAKITGTQEEKLARLETIRGFDDLAWQDCFRGWMEPFLPEGGGDYFAWPLLTDIFPWQHSGVQFKRTWPIGETREVLQARWQALLELRGEQRRAAFRESRDRKIDRQYPALDDSDRRLPSLDTLTSDAPHATPTRYAFRSFDRQWALLDSRLGDFLRPVLWKAHSERQIHLTSLVTGVLGIGPAATISSYIPDLHHFRGSFGGKDVIPLWRDAEATQPNITHDLLATLEPELGQVTPEDLLCYVYALLASPAYVERFSEELTVPGPRIPITKNPKLFADALALGRRLIHLHTFGERFVPAGERRGVVPPGRARCLRGIPTAASNYPEEFSYEPAQQLLSVGAGEFSPVPEALWQFSVSGLHVLQSWLNYRLKEGAGRKSSPLDRIRPPQWTATLTQELLELIWILESTIALLPQAEELFAAVLDHPTFHAENLPEPTADERKPPALQDEQDEQFDLEM